MMVQNVHQGNEIRSHYSIEFAEYCSKIIKLSHFSSKKIRKVVVGRTIQL